MTAKKEGPEGSETEENGAASEEATGSINGKVTRIHFRVVHKTAMLHDRMSPEMIEEVLIRGKRPPPVRDKPLREMCLAKLYSNEQGKYGVPKEAFMAMLREAGRSIKVGKSNISTADSTKLFAFLRLIQDFLPFPDDCQEWEADIRRGQMKTGSTTTAAGIVRPKFKKWGFEGDLEVDYRNFEGLTPRHVRDLVVLGGLRIGLLGFRPTCNGEFGCFNLASWEEQDVKEEERLAA